MNLRQAGFVVVCAAFTAAAAHAGEVIGPEAILKLDTQALYANVVNTAPGDGVDADINPPRFRWVYVPQMEKLVASDKAFKLVAKYNFKFQVSDDPDFKHLIVDEAVEYNFYNELAPFEEGKTYYWRVGYMCQMLAPDGLQARTAKAPLEKEPSYWMPVRKFTVKPGTPKWDRSCLKNPKFADHPRLLFRKDQLEKLREIAKTNPMAMEVMKKCITPHAAQALEMPEWGKPLPDTDTSPNVKNYWSIMEGRLMPAAFMYLLTQDEKYKPVLDMFAKIATYPKGGSSSPEGMGEGCGPEDCTSVTEFLALAYTWFYDQYTPEQRTAFEKSFEWRIDAWMHDYRWGGSLYTRCNQGPYAGKGPVASSSSLMISGSGHSWEGSMDTLPAAIVMYEKSELARRFFHHVVNYIIGVGELDAQNSGYDLGAMYSVSHVKWLLYQTYYLDAALPELHLEKDPFYRGIGEYFVALVPVGLQWSPWGVTGKTAGSGQRAEILHLLAYVSGDGTVLQNWLNHNGPHYSNNPSRPWVWVAAPLHFTGDLKPENGTKTRFFYQNGGYAMAHTYPPTDPKAFKEGVGLIWRCKTSPGGITFTYFNENAFQFYAYGQEINHGSALDDEETSGYLTMSHNTILVDGIGQLSTFGSPDWYREPYRATMLAHKETSDYVYWMGDATNAYPKTPHRLGYHGVEFDPNIYEKKALPYLKMFRRHILFMHNKYLVVFDDLETAQDHPARFTWLWHALPEGEAKWDGQTGLLTYPAGEVKVLVQHASPPAELEYKDMLKVDGLKNPITGEDYSKQDRTVSRMKVKMDHIPYHNFWFTNKEPKSKFHYMTVIFPVKPGDADPKITRLDDYTVSVENGDQKDVISFDKQTKHPATLVVDLDAMRGPIKFGE